ncbi:gamma-glutamyltransferase [Shimia sp. SDUM112013]|uniref:gamma-glutamyltransferase n=1 Tax=Shimia sp. SDUM112013 TaxID=3136160 RepID=UPI0032ECAADB
MGSAVMAQEAADAVAPETATALGGAMVAGLEAQFQAKQVGQPVEAENWMVAAAHPLAVQAGGRVLAAGGTAADAMVAVQAVLGLVEPQSSGLGGGAFLVWYDSESGEITTLDARETAPLAATPRMLQREDGEPYKFFEAVVGGLSVGVPGTPLLMETAHQKWGKVQWQTLFDEAIRLSESGFAVSPRMAQSVTRDAARLAVHPETAAYFLPDGQPLQAGQLLKNPDYGNSLRVLAAQGAAPFYTGQIAKDILSAIRTAPRPGWLAEMDLALYQVKERPAVCADYRGYDVCGMGPPSSGALAVGQILGLLSPFDMTGLGPDNPHTWRLIGDATRLAFADRGRYVADTDFVPVPVQGMLQRSYLNDRSELLRREDKLPEASPGTPTFDHGHLRADDEERTAPSTTHVSIVDSYGNVLSMTASIENAFGSRLMAGGFLLNNQLTDFSFRSHRGGIPIANRVEPGKRPRSSMAPTIVLDNGAPVLAIGSPGGSRIISYVANAIIAHLDWGLDVQQAVSLPHRINRFGLYDIEAEDLAPGLEAMGFETKLRALNSGIHAISIGETLQGGADPRREGLALGG